MNVVTQITEHPRKPGRYIIDVDGREFAIVNADALVDIKVRPGVVTGFLRHGFFVELDEIPVEGFVRVSLYLDDYFVLDDSGVRMTGRRTRRRFCLGDSVQVIVARVDVAARECDFGLDVPARRGRGRRHHGRG